MVTLLMFVVWVPRVLAGDIVLLIALNWVDMRLPGRPILGFSLKHRRATSCVFPFLLVEAWLLPIYYRWYQRNPSGFGRWNNAITFGILASIAVFVLVPQLLAWQLYQFGPSLLFVVWVAEGLAQLSNDHGGGGRGPDEPPDAPEPKGPRGIGDVVEQWLREKEQYKAASR